MKRITDYRIVEHGIEHEQYFQGHGTAFTDWEDCATGIGDTPAEALEDALESLAQNDWDVATIKDELDTATTVYDQLDLEEDEAEGCDAHWYVSVDVKGETL